MWDVVTTVWTGLTSDAGVGFILFALAVGWFRSAILKKLWKDNKDVFAKFFEITQENIPETSEAAEAWLKKPNKQNKRRLWQKITEWKDLLYPAGNNNQKDKEPNNG